MVTFNLLCRLLYSHERHANVNISTNVSRDIVDVNAAIYAITTAAAALNRPAPHVVVQLQSCRSWRAKPIGRLVGERNPKTVALLTETVAEHLHVQPSRVSILLEDISTKHWANNGKVVELLDSYQPNKPA